MNYYALVAKKERGCPTSLVGDVIYDEFLENVRETDYGYKPWYSFIENQGPIFTKEMFLISRNKLMAFDIREGSSKCSIVSSKFLEILRDFSIPIKEIKSSKIVNSKGNSISEKEYYVIVFDKQICEKKDDVVDEKSVFFLNERGTSLLIKKIIIKKGVNKDFFKIEELSAEHNAFFCSEKFMDEVKLRGVDAGIGFMDIKKVPWTKMASFNYYFDCLTKNIEQVFFV